MGKTIRCGISKNFFWANICIIAVSIIFISFSKWSFATQETYQIEDTSPPSITKQTFFEEEPTLPKYYPFPAEAKAAGPVAPSARQPKGSLSGRIVFTCGGHGWTASTPGTGNWYTQRGDNNELVEDLGNADQLAMFVYYCFNAGATVVPFRPVGFQSNEVIVDNDDPNVIFAGLWSDSTSTEFYGEAGDTVPYKYTTSTYINSETAYARYIPNIPEAGFYPVYTWAKSGSDRVNDQLYIIKHSGGSTDVRINHRMIGRGWVYLGTYYFESGNDGYVEINNDSSDSVPSVPVIIADAIRFGNGMGDIDRGGGVSGKTREDEASRYWVEKGFGQGGDTSVYDRPTLSDVDDNVGTPPRMGAKMNNENVGVMTDRVYIGLHTNAYDPGSLGLYNGNNDPNTKTPNQKRLAEIVAGECNDDMVAIGSPPLEYPWPDRRALGYSLTLDRTDIEFGEINNLSINSEFDATIIEIAAHGNVNEARVLLDAKARNWIARACMQAAVKYFNEFGSGPLVFLPEPPQNVRAISNNLGQVIIGWDPPVVDNIGGGAATGYVVYRSTNGYGFGNPVIIQGGNNLSLILTDLEREKTIYFRVAATNAGGESLPSETLAVRQSKKGKANILIVNGFDRINRTMNIRETAASGIGSVGASGQTYDRVKPRLMNSYDYVVRYAKALETANMSFDSCSNESVSLGKVALDDYSTVIWILGEESTPDETFSSVEQTAIKNYLLLRNKNFFVSGTEIGYDLKGQAGATNEDKMFLYYNLKSDYLGDDSGSYIASGISNSILDGMQITFSPNQSKEIYDADYPDQISAINGSNLCANYTGGLAGGAAIQYFDQLLNNKLVMFAFPFECINYDIERNDVMKRILDYFDIKINPNMWYLY